MSNKGHQMDCLNTLGTLIQIKLICIDVKKYPKNSPRNTVKIWEQTVQNFDWMLSTFYQFWKYFCWCKATHFSSWIENIWFEATMVITYKPAIKMFSSFLAKNASEIIYNFNMLYIAYVT